MAETYRVGLLGHGTVGAAFEQLVSERAEQIAHVTGARPEVTGVLTRKREDVHALLRAAGATIHDSVKKDTNYLVAGDKTGKTKLDQARKYGAKVISEEEMDKLARGE